MSNSAASPDGVSPWNGSRSPSGPGDYVSQSEALGRFGNKLPVFGKTFPSMDRLYLVVIVSAFVVLVTAAGLLVTKTNIVARHAHRPPFVRIGKKLPVFGKTFPGTERSGAVNLPHQSG